MPIRNPMNTHDLIRELREDSTSKIVMLVADGMPVAMSSFLVAGTRAFGFKAAYDERFARYAPGLQLLREVGRQVDSIRPLTFDSCTPTGPSIIAEFWKDSVTMLDVAVSLGRGSSLMRSAVSAADGWHDLKIRAAPRLQA